MTLLPSRNCLPWLLVAGVLSFHLWTGSLLDSDDAIYAQAARESLEAGRLLEVTWQGRPLFEKGPLLFWALEGAMAFLGPTDLAARIPGVLAGLLLLLAVHRVARRLGASSESAWAGVWVLLATNLFFFHARRPMTDIPGAALALWGLFGMLDRSLRGALWGGALLGLSALCKVIAPFPVVAALVALQADRRFRAPHLLVTGLGMALAVALPWHLVMTARHGDGFLSTYLGYHLFHRATEAVVGPGAEIYVAWWVEREGPAAVLIGLGIAGALVLAIQGQRVARLAMALLLFGALPLAISRTALPHYLVALVPGIGLAIVSSAGGLQETWTALVRTSESPGRLFQQGPRLAGLALLVVLFLRTNGPDLWSPDYAPSSRDLCATLRESGEARSLLATVDLHDPALVWYCERPLRFVALDPEFHRATRDIPMLRGIAMPATPAFFREVATRQGLLVTLPQRLPALSQAAGAIGLPVRVRRTLPGRVLVSLEALPGTGLESPPLSPPEESNDPSAEPAPSPGTPQP